MNNLKNKLKKNGGFTLIEMLIVVAIIAILIAVSIPLVGSALEKARDATDMANERAAKAEAAIYYLGVGDKTLDYGTGDTATMYYDAANGTLLTADEAKTAAAKTDKTKLVPYGKCTGCSNAEYSGRGNHTTNIIQVVITKGTGNIAISWTGIPS